MNFLQRVWITPPWLSFWQYVHAVRCGHDIQSNPKYMNACWGIKTLGPEVDWWCFLVVRDKDVMNWVAAEAGSQVGEILTDLDSVSSSNLFPILYLCLQVCVPHIDIKICCFSMCPLIFLAPANRRSFSYSLPHPLKRLVLAAVRNYLWMTSATQ